MGWRPIAERLTQPTKQAGSHSDESESLGSGSEDSSDSGSDASSVSEDE